MAEPSTYFYVDYCEEKRSVGILATLDSMEESGEDEEVAFTHINFFDGKEFTYYDVEDIDATCFRYRAKAPIIVGERGEIWTGLGKGQWQKEQLPDSGLDGRRLGPPQQIRLLGKRLYICGFAGQVYTQDRKGAWVHMDDGLAEPRGKADSIALEDIHGSDEDNIYVVGSRGLLAHWNGKKWKRLPVLTDAYLAGVRCLAKNYIMAVGDNGVVIEGDGKRWKVDRIPGAEETPLMDVEAYRDRIYVAGVEDLYVKKGRTWELVDHGLDKKEHDFYKFVVGGGKLWVIGSTRLASFDGKKWRAHIDPDNG